MSTTSTRVSADSEGLDDAGAPKTIRKTRRAAKKGRGKAADEEAGDGGGVNPRPHDDDEEVDQDGEDGDEDGEDEDGEEEDGEGEEEEEEDEEQVDPIAALAVANATDAKPADKRRRRKRPLKKAPGAPKRSKTAYIIFSMYKRPEIKAQVRCVASAACAPHGADSSTLAHILTLLTLPHAHPFPVFPPSAAAR
mmetsp:Transcript_42059/g.112119  ORF Transcript_42059/g.112119 Transcript_42059/m.112119 type:complete len:194 (-) Transcript_42059:1143-1724(-)